MSWDCRGIRAYLVSVSTRCVERPGNNRGIEVQEGESLVPVKYTNELKTRAVELGLYAQADPATRIGAVARIADELGLKKDTLRTWLRLHIESGTATPAEPVDLEAENRRLRAELVEGTRANEILQRVSAFFAAKLDRP